MVLPMWEFIKFLGMVIIILFLIAIIFAIIDTIYNNIKMSIVKKQLVNVLNKKLNNKDSKITIEKIDNIDEKDV